MYEVICISKVVKVNDTFSRTFDSACTHALIAAGIDKDGFDDGMIVVDNLGDNISALYEIYYLHNLNRTIRINS